MDIVKRVYAIIALALAVIWMPATSQCMLEYAELMPECSCCDESPMGEPEEPSEEGDCVFCGELGIAGASKDDKKVQFPVLVLALLFHACSEIPGDNADAASSFVPVAPPPEIPVGWQFAFRAALPSRAPSIVS